MTDDRHRRAGAFTQQLVRIPSVHDPARGLDEEPAAELVAEQMRAFGWAPELDVVAPGRPNVIAVVDGGEPGPTLMFEGHTDVVTEGDGWTVDPFGAELVDGRLWGRGAADMKGGLAAMLFATDAVAAAGSVPGSHRPRRAGRRGGDDAGRQGLRRRGATPTASTASSAASPRAARSATSPRARCACASTSPARWPTAPCRSRAATRTGPTGRAIVALAELEQALQARHGEHPHLGRVWVTPTVLRAGEPAQMNVMPADASVWVDVRTIPAVDHDELVAELTALVADAAAGPRHRRPTSRSSTIDRPWRRPRTTALVRAVWDAHAAVTGTLPRLGGVPGATDGTVITSRTGVPSVVYGPGGKWIAHQADEFVEVDDLVSHAQVYAEAAAAFLPCRPRRRRGEHRVRAGPRNDLTDVDGFQVGSPPAGVAWVADRHDGGRAAASARSAVSTSAAAGRAHGRPTSCTRSTWSARSTRSA